MVGTTGCLVSAAGLNNGGYGPHRRRWIKENIQIDNRGKSRCLACSTEYHKNYRAAARKEL